MDLREMGWQGVDWIHLAQAPVAGYCEHGSEPSGCIKGGEFLEYLCKGKVVPVLLLTEHHAMKAYWGSGGIAPLIL
jgi:hypothetical protein